MTPPTATGWRSRLPLAAILFVGAIPFLPAVDAPRFLDDYLHASMVEGGFPAPRRPFELYDFVNRADRAALTERGLLPWWAEPRLEIRFFRPLSSALRWGEQVAFGRPLILVHLHSFAWWAAAVIAAWVLFGRLFNRRVTILATLMFAIAPSHAIPLTWPANREVLISLAFGTFALGAYTTWRASLRARDGLLAAALFAFAMLGGEYALCLGGYVVGFELFGTRRPEPRDSGSREIGRRVLGLLPFALPAVAYLVARTLLGYGALGSGFYSDPVRDPVDFFRSAPWRFASLVGNAWLGVDTSTWLDGTPRRVFLFFLLLSLPLVGVPLRRAVAGLDPRARGNAAWLLAGSFFSLAPVLAVCPSTRLLGMCTLGIAAAIAVLLDHAWFPATPPPRRGLAEMTAIVALLLGFGHLVQAPVNSFLWARQIRRSAMGLASRAETVARELRRSGSDEVIFVRGNGSIFFLPFALDSRGSPPARWLVLANTGHVLVVRHDARTLEMFAAADSTLYPQQMGDLFRSPSAILRAGQEITYPGLHVTILEVGETGPRSARFVFDRDLEDPSFLWLAEEGGRIHVVTPPQPGLGTPFDP